MRKRPEVFWVREEDRHHFSVEGEDGYLGKGLLVRDLGRDLYDATQAGFFLEDEDGKERIVEVPDGSLIIVKRPTGPDAVIYMKEAWPVLITGRLPGESELHRFKKPW